MQNYTFTTVNQYENTDEQLLLADAEIGDLIVEFMKNILLKNTNITFKALTNIIFYGKERDPLPKCGVFEFKDTNLSLAVGYGNSRRSIMFAVNNYLAKSYYNRDYNAQTKKVSYTLPIEFGNNFFMTDAVGYVPISSVAGALFYTDLANSGYTKDVYYINGQQFPKISKPILPSPNSGYCIMCNSVAEQEIIPEIYTYASNPSVATGNIATFGGKQYITLINNQCIEI